MRVCVCECAGVDVQVCACSYACARSCAVRFRVRACCHMHVLSISKRFTHFLLLQRFGAKETSANESRGARGALGSRDTHSVIAIVLQSNKH